jgi:hypothetical protein
MPEIQARARTRFWQADSMAMLTGALSSGLRQCTPTKPANGFIRLVRPVSQVKQGRGSNADQRRETQR